MSAIVRIVAVGSTALTLLGTAGGLSTAETDHLVGMTYGKASAMVSTWGAKTVIETIVGSRLASDDCIVSSSQKSSFRDINGAQRSATYLINLNCNGSVASATQPGNSVGSPAGRTAAKNIATGHWCVEPEQADFDPCKKFCAADGNLCVAA
jgi:hypothetical protein